MLKVFIIHSQKNILEVQCGVLTAYTKFIFKFQVKRERPSRPSPHLRNCAFTVHLTTETQPSLLSVYIYLTLCAYLFIYTYRCSPITLDGQQKQHAAFPLLLFFFLGAQKKKKTAIDIGCLNKNKVILIFNMSG